MTGVLNSQSDAIILINEAFLKFDNLDEESESNKIEFYNVKSQELLNIGKDQ